MPQWAEPGPNSRRHDAASNSRRAEPAANSRIGWVSGLGFYLAEPRLSEEKIKVLVKLFQKLVVSKGKAFGRHVTLLLCLYNWLCVA